MDRATEKKCPDREDLCGGSEAGPSLVEALRGLRSIDMISAATFIASTGDLSRFESPASLDGLSVSFPLSIPAAGRSVEVASPRLATVSSADAD